MSSLEQLRQPPPGVPAAAAVLRRAPGENFPVAARLLPRGLRRDLMAIYGFARLVDDIGDEAPGDREALLDWLDRELDTVFGHREGGPTHPLLVRLVRTVARHDLPEVEFRRLVTANRRDQRQTTYSTFAELIDYCRYSANPVGRLVLHTFGLPTADRLALSDRICTALQLVEHLQDVGEDARRGRVYLPRTDRDRFGVGVEDLLASRASHALRRLVALEAARASELLDAGAPLVGRLGGAHRAAVAGFVAGGRAALDAVAAAGYDVLAVAARPRPHRVLAHAVVTVVAGR